NQSDPIDLPRLLRARRYRPRHGAAKQRDELAPLHSITSSARASTAGGMSRPSAFAVLRLMARSYLVGACQANRFEELRLAQTKRICIVVCRRTALFFTNPLRDISILCGFGGHSLRHYTTINLLLPEIIRRA